MTVTRKQASSRPIKEEPGDDKSKLLQPLHSCKRVANNNCKIIKIKIPKSKRVLVPTLEVKQEDTDSKLMITPLLNKSKGRWISSEQIKKLIGYITNDNMTLKVAAKKSGMSFPSGQIYYQKYMDDPDRRLPLPRLNTCNAWRAFTSEEIKKLIGYIVDDKMLLIHAAKKLNMSSSTASRYYSMYKNNPDHKIFRPDTHIGNSNNRSQKDYTCEHTKRPIDYTVNDKILVPAALRKIGMSSRDALRSYNKYIDDPERKRATPREIISEKVETLISYVIDDKMSITDAARKLRMNRKTASDRFNKYFNYPQNKGILQPKLRNYPLENDSIKSLLGYILNDKLTTKEAAQKLGIGLSTAFKYYNKFKENPSQYKFIPKSIMKKASTKCSINEKLIKMFEYIINTNMSLSKAAKKANISGSSAKKYYDLYLNDPEHKIPQVQYNGTPPEKIKELIHYIINDKMTAKLAATKAKITYDAALYHFSKYRNKKELNIYNWINK